MLSNDHCFNIDESTTNQVKLNGAIVEEFKTRFLEGMYAR